MFEIKLLFSKHRFFNFHDPNLFYTFVIITPFTIFFSCQMSIKVRFCIDFFACMLNVT